jgi:hypothetical protein
MHRGTWKRRERQIAGRLGGQRLPVSGRGKDEPDAETPLLCIQSKHGRNRPSYLSAWVQGICRVADERQKVGLVVWSTMRERGDDALVILRLKDFEALHGRVQGEGR